MPPANAHLKVMRWQHVAAGTNAHEGQQACEAVHFLAGEGSMRKADCMVRTDNLVTVWADWFEAVI